MSTAFINVAPSDVIGYKQYYRLLFDVSDQGLLFGSSSAKLNYIYDHMGDGGAFSPLSDNPVVGGDTVMAVDVWTIQSGQSLSVAEAVRRLETTAGDYPGAGSSVRSIQKLSGIGDVTGGAVDRANATDAANTANDENSLTNKLGGFFTGLGDYATLAVIALVAYAVISVSAAIIPGRKRG